MISRTRLVVRIAGALTRIPNQTQAILPMLNAQMLAGKVFIEVSIAPIMTNTVPVHCRTLSKRVGLLMRRNRLLWFSPACGGQDQDDEISGVLSAFLYYSRVWNCCQPVEKPPVGGFLSAKITCSW